VHDLTAACRCVLSEAHIRVNVNRGPRRLAVQEQSNGRTRRFSGTDDDAGRLLRLYRPQHAGYPRWDEDHGRPPGGPAKTPHFHPQYGACRRVALRTRVTMARNLQIDANLNAADQVVRDESGGASRLALSTEHVTISNPGDGNVLLVLGAERSWSSSRSARELQQRWNSPRLTRITTTRTSSSIPTAASGSTRLMCVKTQFTADRRAATCWSEGRGGLNAA
jgi:hypothetical protein